MTIDPTPKSTTSRPPAVDWDTNPQLREEVNRGVSLDGMLVSRAFAVTDRSPSGSSDV